MGNPLEDVAHISANLDQPRLIDALVSHFVGRGYRRMPMKSETHLLKEINWDSPLLPPPEFRCFMVLPTEDGWTNLTDELNILDEELASSLSANRPAITVRGYTATGQFEYAVWRGGRLSKPDEIDPTVQRTLSFLQGNEKHLTRLPYDELGVSLPSRVFDLVHFVGFRKC